MSRYDFLAAQEVRGAPFYALIMAAVLSADTDNLARLRAVFPDVVEETVARYRSPGAWLPSDADGPR